MAEKIVQLNEEVIKGELKELVRGSVEQTLNELREVPEAVKPDLKALNASVQMEQEEYIEVVVKAMFLNEDCQKSGPPVKWVALTFEVRRGIGGRFGNQDSPRAVRTISPTPFRIMEGR